MKKEISERKYIANALIDCAIIIGASISGVWWLLLLLLLNSMETSH